MANRPFALTTILIVALCLIPTQASAECGPGSTPPTANLSLIEENEEGWAKLQIAHTGFEFGGFAWHYRQQGDGWFAGRPPSPNVWSLDITCMDVPELVILDGAGCEPVHRELSVGPYDYTPSLAVVGMSNCGTGDCRASVRYESPYASLREACTEYFTPGDSTTSVNCSTNHNYLQIAPVTNVLDVALSPTQTTIFSLKACGSKLVQVSFPASIESECENCKVAPCPCTGDPVHTASGNMRLQEHDPLPGSPLFPMTRTFDSRTHRYPGSAFSAGWTSLFDTRLSLTSGRYGITWATVITEDGQQLLYRGASGTYEQSSPSDVERGRLANDPITNALVHYDADGRRERHFASNGRINLLRDRETGREVQFTYDASGTRVIRVVDSWGTWAWDVTWAAGYVSKIEVDGRADLTWTYVYYDDALKEVYSPQGLWRTYELHWNSLNYRYLIRVVRDGQGRELERHDYNNQSQALSSYGPSGEIQSYQQGLAGRSTGEYKTIIQWKNGRIETRYYRYIASRMRTTEIAGACSSCSGGDEGVWAYDESGNAIRKQDVLGYVTEYTWDAGAHLIATRGPRRLADCDPETAPSGCRISSEALAEAVLVDTAWTMVTTSLYEDPLWPHRPTRTQRSSARNVGDIQSDTFVHHPQTGIVTSQTTTGWTGLVSPALETHTTTTSLYGDNETAAFDPGSPYFPSAYLALPQPKHRRKSIDGPRSDVTDVTTFVYYPIHATVPVALRGQLAAVRDASGTITRYEGYDLFGNVTRTVDANGVVTEAQFDGIGRAIVNTIKGIPGCDTVADPLCATDVAASRGYDGTGKIFREVSPSGGVTEYTYDSRARIATITRGPDTSDLRERIELTYDVGTGKKSIEKKLERVGGSWVERTRESTTYDAAGRLGTSVHADNTSVAYSYDIEGRISAIRDENHIDPHTFYEYDPVGRLTKVRQQLGSSEIETMYAYDLHGNLTAVTDPNGNTTTYLYDDFGRMLRQTSPVTGTTTYEYDVAGNLVSTTDANSATTTRTYDALSRVLTSTSSRPSTPTESITWTYGNSSSPIGSRGRLFSMSDPTGTTTYGYERRGMLASESRTIESASYETRFRYDLDGNRAAIVYPSGMLVTYAHDYAGRPISANKDSAPLVTSTSYLPFGPPKSLTFGNGTTKTMTYDNRYRMQSNALTAVAGTIASYAYTYDAAGNILTLNDQLDATYNRTFAYDDLNRLITANSGASLWGTGAYTYDAMGNMLTTQLGASTRTFAYDGPRPKLTSVTEAGSLRAVTYDAAGNEIAIAAQSSTYTSRNLLAEAGESSYEYDGRGVRTITRRTESSLALRNVASTAVVALTGDATFTEPLPAADDASPEPTTGWYDDSPEHPMQMTSSSQFSSTTNTLSTLHRHSLYTLELNLMVETEMSSATAPAVAHEYIWFAGHPLAQFDVATNETAWYFTDHLGTPVLQTSATATPIWRVEREPYGTPFASRITTTRHQPLSFPGQEEELGGDISYNIFRWYRSGWGRYTQADPIGLVGREYPYASDNPTLNTDSLGLRDTGAALRRPAIRTVCRIAGKAAGWAAGRALGLIALFLSASEANPVEFETQRGECDPCKEQGQRKCRPCIPPVGTLAYREDTDPRSRPHRGVPPPHWKLYEMHQSPPAAGCKCFWHPIPENSGGFGRSPAPPGTVPITQPMGGGFW